MFLEYIDIVGFRGINRLSLTLEDSTLLLGENAWGKSSLLDALSLLLAPDQQLYQFKARDFHFPAGDISAKERYLHIVLTFCQPPNSAGDHARYHRLNPVLIHGDGGNKRIYYRVEGELSDDGSVATWRSFLDADGEPLLLHHIDQLARELMRMHPVLRLRDARLQSVFAKTLPSEKVPEETGAAPQQLASQLTRLTHELKRNPQRLSNNQLREGLAAMQQLLGHYFAQQGHSPKQAHPSRPPTVEKRTWRALDSINQMAAQPASRSIRLLLLGLFSTLLQAQGNIRLDIHARPLLLVEDPETRLHPIMLSVAWGLLAQLPLQRITTTNSSELVSLVPVEQLCRLVRESSRVATYRLGAKGLNTEDSRRISFHIRFHRPSSLFARCWLLVEGETEVWLLSEMANQCGYNLAAEGVKVIQFAQCGLRPLLHFARRMGIDWHVLTDGDDAGKKYAATVRSLLVDHHDIEQDRLTVLPAPDMENFMYRNGFSPVYHRVAGINENAPMPARKIIEKAIHRTSKPDLAIEVAMQAGVWGTDAIPPLLKKMFSRVLWLARGRAD